MISALLDPEDGQALTVTGRSGPEDSGSGRRRPAGREAAPLQDTMSRFAEEIVNRMFSVGLSLESARSIVGGGPAGDRVAAATGEVDRMIADIRTRMFSLAVDAGNHSPDRSPLPPGGHAGPPPPRS